MGNNSSTYFELLKHPRWQRKRLQILQRFDFKCESCGTGDVTLHVHHTYYEKGLAPWEYPDESLQALCEECHRKAQDLMTLVKRHIGNIPSHMTQLLGYAVAIESDENRERPFELLSYEMAVGIADYWGLTAEEVIGTHQECMIDGKTLHLLALAAGKRKF